ncbi:hypothetical protein [Pedobacter sp.]
MPTENDIVKYLREHQPSNYEKIVISLSNIPSALDCLQNFNEVINSYCYHKGIEITHLTENYKGSKAQAKARQDFYAVLLYLVQPLKLFGVKSSPNPELMQKVSFTFSDDYKNVSHHIRWAIRLFEVDKAFRLETVRVADLVRSAMVTA